MEFCFNFGIIVIYVKLSGIETNVVTFSSKSSKIKESHVPK